MIAITSAAVEDHLHGVRSWRVVLGPDQYLFHVGDPVTALHVVHAGWVHLVRHQNDGSLLVLQRAGPGSIVAEASLYSERYHCDAVAPSSAQLLAFTRSDVQQRLRTERDFAAAWASHLTRELQRARLHAEILSLKTVAQRLAAWIAWRDGEMPSRGDWKTVASEIGVSPEALYRELAKRRLQSL